MNNRISTMPDKELLEKDKEKMVRKIQENKHENVNILCLNSLEKKCNVDWIFSQLSLVIHEVENSRKEEYTY